MGIAPQESDFAGWAESLKLRFMKSFRVIAIAGEIAQQVRETRKAPCYGHPAHTEIATGHGPCRHCLRAFAVGKEERVLFTYNSFSGVGEVPLPGPVLIHAEECRRYPETSGYPAGLLPYGVLLLAYGRGQTIVARESVASGQEEAVCRLLENPEVEYVEVRDLKAGCFDFRVERAA